MATNVHLTPELESFAKACVQEGRYNNVSEVVRDALRMLKDSENRRKDFKVMLDSVRDEARREDVHRLDDVLADMDEAIESERR